ncbi:MAG: hypothetical protein HWD59_05110 [Coxiellaceae bacterium]|nr:MAG: hypothetical protein HWD59_05110 [Coxiellaceae bacterium]
MNQSNYQIKLLQQLGKDLFRLVLLPDVLASALKFIAGQYIQVLYPDQTYQPFSIANAPTNEGVIELLIRLQSDDVATDAFLNQCRSNQKVILRGPFGDAYYRSDARPMLVLAAGTGFAYAKAIIEQAIQTDHSRFIHFYWGVKRPEDFVCLICLNHGKHKTIIFIIRN